MNADAWSAVGSMIGGLGGLAGFIALWRQEQQRRSAASLAHLPSELRALLLDVVKIARDVELSPRSRAWTEEHVKPLQERFAPIKSVATAAPGKAHVDQLVFVDLQLTAIHLYAYDETDKRPSAEVAHRVAEQTGAAKACHEAAVALLTALSANGR